MAWTYSQHSGNLYHNGKLMAHGDSVSDPGNASEGCIVIGRRVRSPIVDSADREWVVER